MAAPKADDRVYCGAYVPSELRGEVIEQAEKNGRSMSSEIIFLLREALAVRKYGKKK